MRILGRGLVARALAPHATGADDAVAFAGGVSDSRASDEKAFERERATLAEALAACRRDGTRLLYFSSAGEVYAPRGAPWAEDAPVAPRSAYGRHKLACEGLVRTSGARHLILRVSNLVGRGQNPAQLVPALVAQALRGRARLFVHAERDLLDADDFARIVTALAEADPPDGLVNVASGRAVAVERIFEEVQRIVARPVEIERLAEGAPQRISIARLREILPRGADLPEDYYRRVLSRRVPEIVADLR